MGAHARDYHRPSWHGSTGKVALVSGAASGIGAAVATRLADEGATVVRCDIVADGVDVVCDVTRPGVVRRGGGHSCSTTTAASTSSPTWPAIGISRLIGDLTPEEWRDVIDVNLTGTFLLDQRALPALLDTKGAIVNMGSVAGLRATPYNAAYCASKGGVIMLTKSMAIELAKAGVRVNAVCPGSVDTPFLRNFRATRGCRHGPADPGRPRPWDA